MKHRSPSQDSPNPHPTRPFWPPALHHPCLHFFLPQASLPLPRFGVGLPLVQSPRHPVPILLRHLPRFATTRDPYLRRLVRCASCSVCLSVRVSVCPVCWVNVFFFRFWCFCLDWTQLTCVARLKQESCRGRRPCLPCKDRHPLRHSGCLRRESLEWVDSCCSTVLRKSHKRSLHIWRHYTHPLL